MLGELIGIGAAALAAVVLGRVLGEPDTTAERLLVLGLMALVGAVEGLALSGLQWRLLRERLPRLPAREWIGITVAVAVVGWLIGMAGPLFGSASGDGGSEPGLLLILVMAAVTGAPPEPSSSGRR